MKDTQPAPRAHATDPTDSDSDKRGYYPRMQAAVEALLILKGIISAEDIERELAAMAGRDYRRGAAGSRYARGYGGGLGVVGPSRIA